MSEFNENIKIEFAGRLNDSLKSLDVPIRGRAQWIQKRLSFKISVNGVKKWLEAESLPSSARYEEVARICGVSTIWLMSGKEGETFTTQDFDAHLSALLKIAEALPDAEASLKCMKAINKLSQF